MAPMIPCTAPAIANKAVARVSGDGTLYTRRTQVVQPIRCIVHGAKLAIRKLEKNIEGSESETTNSREAEKNIEGSGSETTNSKEASLLRYVSECEFMVSWSWYDGGRQCTSICIDTNMRQMNPWIPEFCSKQ